MAARARKLRPVAPAAPTHEPEIQIGAVLKQVDLLYLALVGLHHLGEDSVLTAADIEPVRNLAGGVQTDLQQLDRQLTAEWAAREKSRTLGRRGA